MNQGTESRTDREVRDTQPKPVAGIWSCEACGRRIQVIMESDVPKKQAFVCVCGAEMKPGDEHATVGEDAATVAEDMKAVDKVGP